MRLPLILLLAFFSAAGSAREPSDSALPLPQWYPDELEKLERLGGPPGLGILLPPDTTLLAPSDEPISYLQTGPRLADGPPAVYSDHPDLLPQDLALFLPDSILRSYRPADKAPEPTPAAALRQVTAEVLEAASGAPGNVFLIDPQGLVPEIAAEQIERFLAFHASDARIRAYVMVLDRDQTLPPDAHLDRIACGSLGKGPSCLLVYPLGEPWRARLFLSNRICGAVTPGYLADMSADCVKDALLTNDPEEQLHRFAVRLSTRLFWLQERAVTALPAHQPGTLQEVQGDAAAAGARFAASSDRQSRGQTALIALLAALAVAGALIGLRRLQSWRLHHRRMRVWLLPERETMPRLGGSFSGGCGASISFRG